MKLRRMLVIGSVGTLVTAFTAAAALAVSLQAYCTVNGSGGPVTVRYHSNATTYGTVAYDSNVGPVPVPTNAFFEQGVAYYPFARPTANGGNQLAPFYHATVSGPTGKAAWVLTTSFWVTGTYTAKVTSTAYAELKSGTSTAYYNYTGTGTCGCAWEDEDFVRVYVS